MAGETPQQVLERAGLTRWVAQAIVKVLGAESGLHPTAENPKEGAYGIAQWTANRKAALFAFAAAKHEPASSLRAQLEYLVHELNTTEQGTRDRLRATHTIAEAIDVFVVYYERPENDAEVERRAGSTSGAAAGVSAASVSQGAPMSVSTGNDPPDRSQKIYHTGKGMGEQGSHFAGHVAAMRNLRTRHVPIKVRS